MERRQATMRPALSSPYKRHELLTGTCTYPLPEFYDGYGDPQCMNQGEDVTLYIGDAMRADWIANRDKLMAVYTGKISEEELWPKTCEPWIDHYRAHPLPWAATVFDNENVPAERLR